MKFLDDILIESVSKFLSPILKVRYDFIIIIVRLCGEPLLLTAAIKQLILR